MLLISHGRPTPPPTCSGALGEEGGLPVTSKDLKIVPWTKEVYGVSTRQSTGVKEDRSNKFWEVGHFR